MNVREEAWEEPRRWWRYGRERIIHLDGYEERKFGSCTNTVMVMVRGRKDAIGLPACA